MSSPPSGSRPPRKRVSRRNVLKRVSAGGLSLAALGALPGARAASEGDSLTIVHGTQFHGRFGQPNAPDMSRYATVVDELRDEYTNSALIATGDDIAKAPLATVLLGKHIVDAMNYLDPLAGVIGNHEFDYGDVLLRRRMADSSFPWVSANLLAGRERALPKGSRWITRSVGDLTVGVFGLSLLDFSHYVYYPQGYRTVQIARAAQLAVDELNAAGADYVICASHLRLAGSKAVAGTVDGIDLMVGDHAEHVLDEPLEIDGTVINTVGAQFERIGRVTLDENGLDDAEVIEITPATDRDPGMKRIVRKWRRRYDIDNPVGEDVPLPFPL